MFNVIFLLILTSSSIAQLFKVDRRAPKQTGLRLEKLKVSTSQTKQQ